MTKSPSTTSLEFLTQIRAQWSEAGPIVDSLTQLYARVRFGHEPLTESELAEAESQLRTLRLLRRSIPDSQQPSH